MSQVVRQTTNAAAKILSGSVFWMITAAITLVCFLSGPFGTLEALPSGFRLIYWALIVLSTGLLGLWIHALIRSQQWLGVSRIALVSAVFGFCASGLVILLSLALLNPIQSFPGPVDIFVYSFPSATVIFFIMVIVEHSQTETTQPLTNTQPALTNRLEKHSGARKVLALCAQDHYVEVITEKGSELCLLRLNDAIAESAPEIGLQIHRSHWVAKSAIKKAELKGPSPQVRLIDGRILKVSQSRLKELEMLLR